MKFEERIAQIETLIQQLESRADPEIRRLSSTLVAAVLDLHKVGFGRILSKLDSDTVAALDNDELLRNLLILHSLSATSLQDRVRQALAETAPKLASQGGSAELLGCEEGTVMIRLHSASGSCPSKSGALKLIIEEAFLEAAPDIVELRLEQASTSAQSIPVTLELELRK